MYPDLYCYQQSYTEQMCRTRLYQPTALSLTATKTLLYVGSIGGSGYYQGAPGIGRLNEFFKLVHRESLDSSMLLT